MGTFDPSVKEMLLASRGSGSGRGLWAPTNWGERLCRHQAHLHCGADRHCRGGRTSGAGCTMTGSDEKGTASRRRAGSPLPQGPPKAFLWPHHRHRPISPLRGARLPWGPAAPVPGSSRALPWENLHENHKKLRSGADAASACVVRDEQGGGGSEESHSFPSRRAASPAKPQSQPQGSAQDGGFPARISLLLRPPCLLLVVAAGGGVRRRCDSLLFKKIIKRSLSNPPDETDSA